MFFNVISMNVIVKINVFVRSVNFIISECMIFDIVLWMGVILIL